MKTLISTLFAVLLCSSFVSCRHKEEKYHDAIVRGGELRGAFTDLAVHVSPTRYLEFDGKTYYGIRGSKPYYLKLPDEKSILFVSEKSKGKVLFWVINTETKEVTSIDAGTSGFGWSIGTSRKAGEPGTDYVESFDGTALVLVQHSFGWKERTKVNLPKAKIENSWVEK